MGFSRQEYWSGLSWPSPGDLPNPGIEPVSLMLHWQTGSLPLAPPGKPLLVGWHILIPPRARSFQTKEEFKQRVGTWTVCSMCGGYIMTILIWLEPQACEWKIQGWIITRKEVKKAEIGRHQIVLGFGRHAKSSGFTFGPVFLKMEPTDGLH